MSELGPSEQTGAEPRGSAPATPAAAGHVTGGRPYYGAVAGVLVFDSTTPRVPGDPGHAATFSFPVVHEVVRGFTFNDLQTYDPVTLTPVLDAVLRLQDKGVHFIIADCGLFSLYQREISAALHVPFIGSSLSLIPFIQASVSPAQTVGVITGHSAYLSRAHLEAVGVDMESVAIEGMENCAEFVRVVINGGPDLNVDALRAGTLDAAARLRERVSHLGALILECPNLATFRSDLVGLLGIPVFDVVSVAELFAAALKLEGFPRLYPHR